MSESIRLIAEVSSNHDRDLDRSLKFVDVASQVGFTAVKFQLFRIDSLFSPEARDHNPSLDDRRAWELPEEFIPPLAARARAKGLEFACTPFYLEAVEVLEPYVDFFKIASYELLWDDLILACAQTGKPLILSTGMANMDEVQHAVDVARGSGVTDLTLLHCVSAYPARPEDANLRAIETMRHRFDVAVGWSDHSVSAEVVARAVRRWGAQTVELHFDLDGTGAEFPSGHCWLPRQVELLYASLLTESGGPLSDLDGSGEKVPTAAEQFERRWRADPSDGLRPLTSTRAQIGEGL